MLSRGCQCVVGRSPPLSCTHRAQHSQAKPSALHACAAPLYLGGVPGHEVEGLRLRHHVAGERERERHFGHLLPATSPPAKLEEDVSRQRAVVEGDRWEGHVDHPAGRGRGMVSAALLCTYVARMGAHLSNPNSGSKFSIVRIGTLGTLWCTAYTNNCRRKVR